MDMRLIDSNGPTNQSFVTNSQSFTSFGYIPVAIYIRKAALSRGVNNEDPVLITS